MSKWFVALAPVSGRLGSTVIEAEEVEVAFGGHLLLKQSGSVVAAVAPGSWVSVQESRAVA